MDKKKYSNDDHIKLDFTIESSYDRIKLVEEIIRTTPKESLKPNYLEILTDYIVLALDKKDKKNKEILTENRMVTVNKRETSYQGLSDKFENGEDGIHNIITNDKNVIFSPKVSITEKDLKQIPALKELKSAIEQVEKLAEKAVGRNKYLLKKQLIEMHQDQYVIKNSYNQPMYCLNTLKEVHKICLDETITVTKTNEIQSNGLVSLFNASHVSALLCNYSKIKEECWGNFESDFYFMMIDLDNLIEKTLKDKFPLYYDLLIYKIDGKQNIEIQTLLENDHGIKHSIEYISSLWRNKIPKLLSENAQNEYLIWYFTIKSKGLWKRCSRCKQIKLAHNRFFSKNKTSKDGFYSICKECRNKKVTK